MIAMGLINRFKVKFMYSTIRVLLCLHKDAEAIQTAADLCLGAQIMEPHHRRCVNMMKKQGHHGLSCRESK